MELEFIPQAYASIIDPLLVYLSYSVSRYFILFIFVLRYTAPDINRSYLTLHDIPALPIRTTDEADIFSDAASVELLLVGFIL